MTAIGALMFDLPQLERAQAIVGAAMPPTPAYAWPLLAERLGATVIVKHENHTPTGAFKVRGGLVYVERVTREQPDTAWLMSATRGNHGQSLAFAGGRYGVGVMIYVPQGNSVEKNRAMRAFGAILIEHGEDFQAAREEAERHAGTRGHLLVPSFHPDLVLGVATYALELFRSAPNLDVLLCAVIRGRRGSDDAKQQHAGRWHGNARSRRRRAGDHAQGRLAHRAGHRCRNRLRDTRLLDRYT
jgi:threonine dehydratase